MARIRRYGITCCGMHITVTPPNGRPDREIAERAGRQNLRLWPLFSSYLGAASRPGFVLGFGGSASTEIPNAVRKMRRLLESK